MTFPSKDRPSWNSPFTGSRSKMCLRHPFVPVPVSPRTEIVKRVQKKAVKGYRIQDLLVKDSSHQIQVDLRFS